jgi:redox-sensitive bicupin YhaK (pirin superfamily)
MGNGSIIRAGELQRMTAGTGVRHSEFNPSDQEWVHLYQIWLVPERKGLKPSYEQMAFTEEERQGTLRLVASPTGEHGSLTIHQDTRLYLSTLKAGETVAHALKPGRHAWLQVLRGRVALNGHLLSAGDGAAVSEVEKLEIRDQDEAEVMLFDLA